MTTVAAPTRWTYHDYLRLDDDQPCQIVEGELIMFPALSIVHQRVSSRLYSGLQPFVAERNLGEVFYAPVDVAFREHDIVQPDLLFVRRENAGIVGKQAMVGTPDLVVEILSPGSLHLERHRKRALYERAGVPEFWLVDPANRAIEVFRLGERGYELASFAAETGSVRSVGLDGFEVDSPAYFDSVWASCFQRFRDRLKVERRPCQGRPKRDRRELEWLSGKQYRFDFGSVAEDGRRACAQNNDGMGVVPIGARWCRPKSTPPPVGREGGGVGRVGGTRAPGRY